jgi:hypothetical protein
MKVALIHSMQNIPLIKLIQKKGSRPKSTDHNIGYSQWWITANEKIITLKQISQAQQTSALNHHCL